MDHKARIIIAAALLAALAAVSPAAAQQPGIAKRRHGTVQDSETAPRRAYRDKGMRLVWAEEFEDTGLDTTAWSRCEQGVKQWNGHMSPADTVCRISGGTLKLYGLRTPPELGDARDCITGGIHSKGKRSIRFGRVDVRARIVGGKGFWPAIWLIPDVDIPWPRGGEIDIMEHLNHDPEIHQTVHTYLTWKGLEKLVTNHSTTPVRPDEFNVYSVEMTPYRIEFFVNGRSTHVFPRLLPDREKQFPFRNNPFYIILSAQLGGTWVGEIDLGDLPVVMEIDYVRLYEKRH